MRLLNTATGELVWFSDTKIKDTPYAILSHVWGKYEQSYEDVSAIPPLPQGSPMHGMRDDLLFPAVSACLNPKLSPKIRGACIYALSLGFEWIWIDTCCIDKTSSAELSEAINSMFKWYAKATVCIVYLEDVHDPRDAPHGLSPQVSFLSLQTDPMKSRWFTRGWTLQELVAPRIVEFVSRGWQLLGTKAGMAARLERRTHIDAAVLRSDRALSAVCVADRMRWAVGRQTTRVEDRAYSLLGIFDVNLPTLYGEGDAAFQRLQEAIIASSSDATLFMWNRQFRRSGLLASVPEDYINARSLSIMPVEEIPVSVDAFLGTLNARTPSTQNSSGQLPPNTPSFTKTSHGVRAWIPLIRCARHHESAIAVMAVQCEGEYQGLALKCAAKTQTLHHYTVLGTVAPSTVPEFWSVRDGDAYSVEWTDIYVTVAAPAYHVTPWERAWPTLDVPPWVLSRMSRHYGFFLLDDCANEEPVSITRTTEVRVIERPSCQTLTFTSADPYNRELEKLQVQFSRERPAQGGVALLGFYIRAVRLNGHEADIIPGPASAGRSDGTLWFGDENRAVGFTPLSGQCDPGKELDITLSGRVYERFGQIYGARWQALFPAADNNVRPPSLPSTRDSFFPMAVREDLGEVQRMIRDAMAPLWTELANTRDELADTRDELADTSDELADTRAELGSARAELGSAKAELARVVPRLASAEEEVARVAPRLAAAEKVARLAAADKVVRLKQTRTFRRRL